MNKAPSKCPLWSRIDNALHELFTQGELDFVCSSTSKSRKHPFGELLTQVNATSTQASTEQAFRTILQRDLSWLKSLKARLVGSEYSDVSAALAELRAYGALSSVFNGVKVVPRKSLKTPDFEIQFSDQVKMFVEVHAKQWHRPQLEALAAFLQKKPPPPAPGCRISVIQHAVRPFGQPKKRPENHRNELIVENMISRIAAIKESDKQIPAGMPSVLWLDFQDAIWDGFALGEHLFPVLSWNGALSSGGLWHAFYGQKETRLMENSDICIGMIGGTVRMQHEGRFYQIAKNHRAAGVVVSLPKECVVFENPNTENALPQQFVVDAIRLPWFRLQKCWLNRPPGALAKRLELARNEISALMASSAVL